MKRKAAGKITKWRQAAKPPPKTAWADPGIAGTVTVPVRPPPPGEGKRGEKGHLAYLLRQAQAATRLQMTLTPRGATLLQDGRRRVTALERRLAAGLSRNAEVAVRRWLAKIAAQSRRDG